MTQTSEAAGIQIYNAAKHGEWNDLRDIRAATGLSQDELQAGVNWWMACDDFRAEPEAHRRRADKDSAVMVGGEPRHKIMFAGQAY